MDANPGSTIFVVCGIFDELPQHLLQFPRLSNVTEIWIYCIKL